MTGYLIILVFFVLLFLVCVIWLWRDPLRFCVFAFTDLVAFRVLTGGLNINGHLQAVDLWIFNGTIEFAIGNNTITHAAGLLAALVAWIVAVILYWLKGLPKSLDTPFGKDA